MQLGQERLRLRFASAANNNQIQGLDQQPAHSNYLLGDAPRRTSVPHFARVQTQGLYRGIDVVYYGQNHQLEFDFLVAPGADPNQIAWRIEGANHLDIHNGELVATSGQETLRWHKPFAYQLTGNTRVEVPSRFHLQNGLVRFELGDYDQTRPLVIDPVVSYSSYLGGRGNEAAASVARDASGNIYLTGVTTSAGLAVTRGVIQSTYGGDTTNRISGDAYVAKLNAAGVLQYLTFLGGAADDYGTNVGVDAEGNAYITGFTNSRNFPVSANAYQKTFAGSGGGQPCKLLGDAFVTKLNPTGTQIIYSTYLGGSLDETASALLVDTDGSVYVTGATVSRNFPTTAGAYQRTAAGSGGQPATGKCGGAPSFTTGDAFLTKLDPTGSSLVFSTLIGGSRDDAATSVGLDANKNIYLAGSTVSIDFPTTAGAYQRTFAGVDDQNFFLHLGDGWIAKLNPTASSLIYSTYLGGRQDDLITSMRVDAAGIVTVGGATGSTNFPTTATAIGKQYSGYFFLPFEIDTNYGDGFITRLNAAGSGLLYSTYIGGQNNDVVNNFWIDAAGLIYAVGWTDSPNFRVTADAQQRTFAGNGGQAEFFTFGDGFLTVIDTSVATPVYSSFFGGRGDDEWIAITGDGGDGLWLVGNSMSTDFITTASATQRTYGGFTAYDSIKGDALIMRLTGFTSKLALAAITNAASNALNIVSPGMVFVGYGANMGPANLIGAAIDTTTGNLATSRSGTRVLFDGVPAPLVYVSAGQLSGIVPYAVASKSSTQVVVESNGQTSSPLTVSVAPAAPGLFSLNFSGSGPAVVFNEDGTVNSATNPASKGSIIVLYGTGEGQTTPAGVDGLIASSVFPKPVLPVTVLVGNVPASDILYAGAVPGNVTGVLQVNARLAATTPSGTQSLVLRVGSFSSQSGLTVFIR